MGVGQGGRRARSGPDRESIPEKSPIIICMPYEQRRFTDRNSRIRNTRIKRNDKEKQEVKSITLSRKIVLMANTVTSFELGWRDLVSPVPRKEWSRNHRSKPRHRISRSRVVAIAVVGLGIRLPGVLCLGFGIFLWWECRRNPKKRGVG